MIFPGRALVRRPPRSYRDYYAAHGVTIDLSLADRQHAAYVAALESAGLIVEYVGPNEALADGVFIEDTVVVWKNVALVTRMVDRREGEQAAVVRHLRATHDIASLPRSARLEGGDVLHTDDTTYVGLSARTNKRGVDALREMLAPEKRRVVAVPVERCLHLKSAATFLGDGYLLASREWIDTGRFDVDHVVDTAPGESKAANAIRVADHLLTLDGYPVTGRRVRAFADQMDVTVHALKMSEFEKGDGSLTCLSVVLSRQGEENGVHPAGRRASSSARTNSPLAPIRRSTTMASMAKSAAKAVREAASAMEDAKSALEHARSSFKESRSAAAKGSAKAKAAIKQTVDKVTGRAKKRRRIKVAAATGLAAVAVAGGIALARSRSKKNTKKIIKKKK